MGNPIVGRKCCENPQLEELCERALSYFWDRLSDGGVEAWPEVEMLADDMMVSEEELITMFHELGYGDPEDEEEEEFEDYD